MDICFEIEKAYESFIDSFQENERNTNFFNTFFNSKREIGYISKIFISKIDELMKLFLLSDNTYGELKKVFEYILYRSIEYKKIKGIYLMLTAMQSYLFSLIPKLTSDDAKKYLEWHIENFEKKAVLPLCLN